jgi:hypothetical protein
MITLFHLNHEADPMIARELSFPMTEEMNAVLATLRGDSADHLAEAEANGARYAKLRTTEFLRLANDLWQRGCFVQVAEIEGDVDYAYKATQNGVLSASWSQEPPAGVTPSEPSYHLHAGERYGRKSTEVGDILKLEDGRLVVVDRIGFVALDGSGKL